jgi:hypothetical protein
MEDTRKPAADQNWKRTQAPLLSIIGWAVLYAAIGLDVVHRNAAQLLEIRCPAPQKSSGFGAQVGFLAPKPLSH